MLERKHISRLFRCCCLGAAVAFETGCTTQPVQPRYVDLDPCMKFKSELSAGIQAYSTEYSETCSASQAAIAMIKFFKDKDGNPDHFAMAAFVNIYKRASEEYRKSMDEALVSIGTTFDDLETSIEQEKAARECRRVETPAAANDGTINISFLCPANM